MKTSKQTQVKPKVISQGVETLILRLKTEGVEAGKTEANRLKEEAELEANQLLDKARAEANQLITEAYEKIKQEKQATLNALKLALRDMRLELRQQLINRFKEEVNRLIHHELNNEDTIRQMILSLTCETEEQLQAFKNSSIEIQLPENILEFESIRHQPKMLEQDPLKQLILSITGGMLRKGLSFNINTEHKGEVGLKVRVVGEEHQIEFDLSEEAINALLFKHLQPRFRALLEGLLQ